MNAFGQRIAVTGVGVVGSLGRGAPKTFARLLRGERGLGRITLFPTDGLRSGIAAEVPEACLGEEKDWTGFSRTDRMALLAAQEALESARYRPESAELGLAFGATAGAMFETEQSLTHLTSIEPLAKHAEGLVAYPLSRTVSTLEQSLGQLSVGATLCSACSSGAVAIIRAAHWIQSGIARAVLAGGADGLCRMTFAGFSSLGVLDAEACRPFDRNRSGLSLGEGAGFLLLEPEDAATARGAPILGWLSGWALGAEAHHSAHPEPSGARAAELMRAALASAGLEPSEIDYVNAHGTGTIQNDRMEAAALRLALGSEASRVRVSSIKGQLGHLLGAAGAVEAAISVLALESSVIPPTVGLTEPEDPGLAHVLGEPYRGPIRAVLSNSFGFGGMDAVLLFEARDARLRTRSQTCPGLVITGSAISRPPSDPIQDLDPDRSRRFDALASAATHTARLALDSARLDPAGVGLVLGNAYANVDRSVRFLSRILVRGLRHASPAEFPHLLHSAPAGLASIYLGLSGPVFAVVEQDLGAEAALVGAAALLQLGIGTAVLAGAVETLDPLVRELSPRPNGHPRGEGGGLVVLERIEEARKRDAPILCRLTSWAEERGNAREAPTLSAPAVLKRARLLLCGDRAALLDRVRNTAWEGVSTQIIPGADQPTHEAIGASALIEGIESIASGALDEVLIVAGGATRRFWIRFERSEPIQ